MSTTSQQKKGGGWGSFMANIESRLDSILADDPEASSRQREAEAANKARPRAGSGNLGVPARSSTQSSRDGSRTRVNDRLAERLAKATAAKPVSGAPSRTGTPLNDEGSVRASEESTRSRDAPRSVTNSEKPSERSADGEAGSSTLQSSGLPINPARHSAESSRPSLDVTRDDTSSRPSADLTNGHASRSAAELEAEMERMREDHAQAEKQRQEEMHAYLEKIDALQAKLQYLAQETVAAAKEANGSTSPGDADKKLAEKDERIALLMEEGEKLSKTELRHLQTIKKLRAKTTEDEKAAVEVRKKLERAERAEADLKQKLRKAEVADRQANEKLKQIANIDKQVEELRVDRENAADLIRTLTTQLKQANDRAERAEKEASSKATEIDRERIASLENDLEDAQIEKKLAEDRAAAEIAKMKEAMSKLEERFGTRELEFKNEVAGLESRLEAMRARAEEASSEGVGGNEGSVKLMRQVETLQSQYSLAKANWETIEGSLNARISALESERDEAARRGMEGRRKTREAGQKQRKAEDELEAAHEEIRGLVERLKEGEEEIKTMARKLQQAEDASADARAEFERQRKLWEAELNQRVEEERMKWQRNAVPSSFASPHRTDSPATSGRKGSIAVDLAGGHNTPRRTVNRVTSHDLAALHTDTIQAQRPVSRRSSGMPNFSSARNTTDHSSSVSPSISRQESVLSLANPSMPPTPSIEVEQDFERPESPQRTINDLVSTSTAGAGPSVQLVERMSAAVRRLESEKATFKDEIARLSTQRDEARDEVVALMREVEAKRGDEQRLSKLEGDLKEVKSRYEASLEMLGEREEEVQELKQDVLELKKMYRELVEEKVGPGR